ncbi:discoidin domain-containing protein [Pseudodesulfovibrio piezophilus]|nr:discoidin domain-containing protein [Pseudodesulfovibrio piezophilus]
MRIIQSFLSLFVLLLIGVPGWAMDVTVSVSSVKVEFGLPHTPDNLMDGDPSTAWVGGGIGPGVGQWIELDFGIPVRVSRLGIFNGHQGKGQFHAFRRIRSGKIVYPDGTEVRFWLRDEPGEQIIECAGKPSKSLRLVVESVFPKGEVTSKVKLAVSEIKLYLTLMELPMGDEAHGAKQKEHTQAPPPQDPNSIVPEPLVELLREFYVRQTSLADDYAKLFAEDVRDRNDFRFEVFKEIQRQRGTYSVLRTAKVDTGGLGFELVELEGSFARVRVFGAYRVKVANLDRNLEEDSVFVVTKVRGEWKIVELEGEEDLF